MGSEGERRLGRAEEDGEHRRGIVYLRPSDGPAIVATLRLCYAWLAGSETLDAKLSKKIAKFDNEGRSLAQGLVALAYDHQLPMGIEYLAAEAVSRPVSLKLSNTTVRDAISALVTQVPGYRVSFAHGIVEVYSPEARKDNSNLLNTTLQDFEVRDLPLVEANARLAQALFYKMHPKMGFGGSINPRHTPQAKNVTIRVARAPIRQVLSAMVAMDGWAIWIAHYPPDKLGRHSTEEPWKIYDLNPLRKTELLNQLGR